MNYVLNAVVDVNKVDRTVRHNVDAGHKWTRESISAILCGCPLSNMDNPLPWPRICEYLCDPKYWARSVLT